MGRTKDTKMVILGDNAKQPLMRSAIIKDGDKQPVERVNSRESGFTPKRGKDKRGKQESANNV
jgi:hypothetical protein